ncbi:MAG: hypothetical protein R2855_09860 [Thermomicrobiales bacterium]
MAGTCRPRRAEVPVLRYIFDVPYDYGTVYIYKYYCEPGYEWSSSSYDDLYAECTSWQPDVYFEIHNGGYSQGQTTDSSGAATWEDVPGGSLEIVETAPDGYKVGKVFCGVTAQNSGTLPSSWTECPIRTAGMSTCPKASTSTALSSTCRTTTGRSTSTSTIALPIRLGKQWVRHYLLSNCTTPHENVYFETYSGSYTRGRQPIAAAWQPGPMSRGVTLVLRGGTRRVSRSAASSAATPTPTGTLPTSWDEYSYSGWLGRAHATREVPLLLRIFDVPYEYGTVYFYKYYCAPEFDWENGGYDYLLSGCTTPHENVYFETYSGSYAGQTTDTSGAATWTSVPWGDLSFWEDVPDVAISPAASSAAIPTRMVCRRRHGMRMQLRRRLGCAKPPGKYLYCYIFDVPTATMARSTSTSTTAKPDFDWQGGG